VRGTNNRRECREEMESRVGGSSTEMCFDVLESLGIFGCWGNQRRGRRVGAEKVFKKAHLVEVIFLAEGLVLTKIGKI